MAQVHDLVQLYALLAATGLPCMVGGGVAAIMLGEPRTTLDIDIVIACAEDDADRICSAFPADRYYLPPAEVVRREIRRGQRGSFNVIDSFTSLKADVYPAGDDDLIAWGLARRTMLETGAGAMAVAPPTYVVAMKLRYFAISRQDKHLRDIRSLLRIQAGGIDRAIVDAWARQAGVEDAWLDCQARAGEE